ncbi:MAG TPA: hypothetical protein VLB29_19500 [Nocardioidaceae bacterium]|nr:hypothetical protein [Nocardioidaceae bacterium]
MSVTSRSRARSWNRGRSRTVSIVLVVWLLIGVFAAFQRGYFADEAANCSKLGTIAANVVAGPLNYIGLNPKIACKVPEPSR